MIYYAIKDDNEHKIRSFLVYNNHNVYEITNKKFDLLISYRSITKDILLKITKHFDYKYFLKFVDNCYYIVKPDGKEYRVFDDIFKINFNSMKPIYKPGSIFGKWSLSIKSNNFSTEII